MSDAVSTSRRPLGALEPIPTRDNESTVIAGVVKVVPPAVVDGVI